MNDHTPDPHDDLLRDALRAEAAGVTADAGLLARIQAAAEQPAGRSSGRWLLVAAVALVAGLGVSVLNRDGDQVVDSANDPTSTTSTTEVPGSDIYDVLAGAFPCEEAGGYQTVFLLAPRATAAEVDAVGAALDAHAQAQRVRFIPEAEVVAALEIVAPGADWDPASIPSGYLATSATSEDDLAIRGDVSDLPGISGTSSTDCTEATTPDIARPSVVALVREDGMLVTVDLTTGEERELYSAGDPREEIEGGAYSIDSVELSPDGAWIYFSTCCEPAVGTTFRIPTEGGDVEEVGFGAYPRVSPDGRFVATAGSESVFVFATDDVGTGREEFTLAVLCCSSRLAWSPDGTRLALVHGTGAAGEAREVLLFGWDGTSLSPADLGKPENPGSFVSWQPDGTSVISSGEPIDDERGLSQDTTYNWLLWVDEQGVVREQDGHVSGDRTPIDGLPKALAADW